MARGRDARPLSVGIPRPGGDRARVPDQRKAGQRRRAADPEGSGRFAGRADRRARATARSARRLWNPQVFDDAVRGAPGRRVRARDTARHPPRCAHRVPPHAQPVPALSSGAPYVRRVARHRARHAVISTLLTYMLFSIVPMILEFSLVAAILLTKFD